MGARYYVPPTRSLGSRESLPEKSREISGQERRCPAFIPHRWNRTYTAEPNQTKSTEGVSLFDSKRELDMRVVSHKALTE